MDRLISHIHHIYLQSPPHRAKAPGPEERWYRCSNEKCLHINMTSKDVYGCDRPVYMPYCKYHLKNCHNDHGMLFVRVQEPNPDGKYHRIIASTPYEVCMLTVSMSQPQVSVTSALCERMIVHLLRWICSVYLESLESQRGESLWCLVPAGQ